MSYLYQLFRAVVATKRRIKEDTKHGLISVKAEWRITVWRSHYRIQTNISVVRRPFSAQITTSRGAHFQRLYTGVRYAACRVVSRQTGPEVSRVESSGINDIIATDRADSGRAVVEYWTIDSICCCADASWWHGTHATARRLRTHTIDGVS